VIYLPESDRARRSPRPQAIRKDAGTDPARRDERSLTERLIDALARLPSSQASRRLAVGAATFGAVLLVGASVLPVFASVHPAFQPGPMVTLPVPLDAIALESDDAALQAGAAAPEGRDPALYTSSISDDRYTVIRVEPGQTLGNIFAQLGLSSATMHKVVSHSKHAGALARLYPGNELVFELAEGQLRSLQFDLSDAERYLIEVDGNALKSRVIERALESRFGYAAVEVRHTLFGSATEAGLSDALVLKMVEIFNFDIDFVRDLQRGDRFALVFEEVWRDGEKLRDGNILAATFVNGGKRFEVFRHEGLDGGVDYLSRDGKSRKRAFIRTPLEFSRVSSKFSLARRHPVLGTMRAHRGVDYAAPTGTPIRVTGHGTVAFAGWKGGYGKVVEVQHGKTYRTLYAHMNGFAKNIKVGAKVSQGEVIGYVGRTGLATGPHLHYEFHVNGQHRDPLSVDLPTADPLSGAELARFKATVGERIAQLATMESTLVAAR
jgi:murein DD-endopeptidase MepM/ murein hydrolase activator NlpD